MLDVALSPDTAAPRILDSFRACLSSVLEIPLDEVPQHEDDPPGRRRAMAYLACGARRRPSPDRPCIAISMARVLDSRPRRNARVHGTDGCADVRLAVRRRSQPTEFALLGRAAADLPVEEGYVIAPFDPALSADSTSPAQRARIETASVEAIAIADRAEAPMQQITTARAIPGRGLDGDRYANRAGTFTPRSGRLNGYDLTLIEAEVLDELTLADGQRLGYAEARRNIVTRGIELNTLVGQRFKIGDVECVGRRLCEPCAHLERLTHKGVLRKLIHRGGLRADILTTGSITLGATIERLEPDQPNPPK